MRRVQSDWAICLVITLGTLNAEQVRSVNRQLEEPWEQLIGSGSDHQMQMTVCVYNRYPVPAELLRIALRRTATIFEHAGIRVRWLNCLAAGPQGTTDPVCLPSPRSNTIVLTILGHAGGRYRDSLGYVFQRDDGGKSAVVYYGRVGFMVEFVSENTAELLGAVIAHEIGHALLPGHPHSKAGIMRPEWEAREAHASLRGQMNFSARESCAMRNELNRRAVIESNFPTRSGDTSPTAQTFGLVP